MKKRFYLTYPKELIKEPLIYQVGKLYNVITNIRQATVSDNIGLVAIELDGESGDIEKALNYFAEKGVKVEPIELDVVE
ncbi:MAG: FeS-binding protein [Deltaproteobacteria bacterium GWC2_42_11]|nr:MAG: FeS-binding protein [Deltaproteobacteria bacterium GWC2_42_11]HBO84602.1 FeS-binding protein [Deltaproteobacteria bacterium]